MSAADAASIMSPWVLTAVRLLGIERLHVIFDGRHVGCEDGGMHRLFRALSPPQPLGPGADRGQRLRWIRRRAYLNWSMLAFLPVLIVAAIAGGAVFWVVLACWSAWLSGLATITLQIWRAERNRDRSHSR